MELQTLLDKLYNEPDLEKRRYIPDKLAKLGDWKSTHPLGKMIISDSQPEIMRNEAVESLGKQGDPEAIPYLVQVLEDEVDDIRRTAVWSLGQIGVPETLEPVFSMTNDPNVEVRRWVAKSAGRIRSDKVTDKLREYIEKITLDEERVIADIIRAVTSQIKRVSSSEIDFWVNQCYKILDSNVKNYVKQAVMLLLNEIYNRGISPNTELLSQLFSKLPDNDPLVKPQIILAMGFAGETEFLLSQDNSYSIQALGIAKEKKYVDRILKEDTDETKIVAALEAYTHLEGIPELENWYNHSNLTIQTQALQLHAMNKLPIKRLHEAYQKKQGKYKILEIYRYYGDEALDIFEEAAIHSDKVARQNTVYSLISDEMLTGSSDHETIRKILTKVSQQERIWHIRRDARIGLELIENFGLGR